MTSKPVLSLFAYDSSNSVGEYRRFREKIIPVFIGQVPARLRFFRALVDLDDSLKGSLNRLFIAICPENNSNPLQFPWTGYLYYDRHRISLPRGILSEKLPVESPDDLRHVLFLYYERQINARCTV